MITASLKRSCPRILRLQRAYSTAHASPYRVLVLGGYGTFGSYIADALVHNSNIALTIAGRNQAQALACARRLTQESAREVESLAVDALDRDQLREALRRTAPDLVIHTCGPFQGQGYEVAKECIKAGANYVDLADGREFVCEIGKLDEDAKKKKVVIISGASSVPGLSGAVVEEYQNLFEKVQSVEHYINPGNQTQRGIATVQSVLAYCGKTIKLKENDKWKKVIGWQETHSIALRGVGSRLVSACDIPDLEIFPKQYGIPTVKFYAGLELRALHLATVAMSYLVQFGIIDQMGRFAAPLRKLSLLFFNFGSKSGGMSIKLRGTPKKESGAWGKEVEGKEASLEWQIGVHEGDGPQIPSICAIVLAKKMAAHNIKNNNNITEKVEKNQMKPLYEPGARACVGGFFTLAELREEMQRLKAFFYVEKRVDNKYVQKEYLYEKSIGDSYFSKLPESLKKFHSAPKGGYAEGTCTVTRGNFMGNLLATILRLPEPSTPAQPTRVNLSVELEKESNNSPDTERWQRTFSGKPFFSRQYWSAHDGMLVEEYGNFLKLGMRVKPVADGFLHEHVFTKLFGIKLPLFLSPKANASTLATPLGWKFDVQVTAPLIGLLVRYRGEIDKIDAGKTR